VWTEAVTIAGAEALIRYADGPLAGSPAVTRNGYAWYVTTRLADQSLDRLISQVARAAGVTATLPGAPASVEAVRRTHADGRSYLFLLNHGDAPAVVDAGGVDLLTGDAWPGPTTVPAGGVVVLREGAR
jgi:beta-galactosidase